MNARSWVLSLMLPVLSIAASIILIAFGGMIFTIAFGLVGGGIVPLVIITKNKVDISQFFLGKIIISGALAAVAIPSWVFLFDWLTEARYHVFILPTAFVIAELIYTKTRKADDRQKICLLLSSLVYVYVGITADFLFIFFSLFG